MDNEKQLILIRGLPGSGKSTLAKKLAGQGGVIYSTDDFFMKNGEYVYDVKMIGEYHNKNFERAAQAMQKGISPIVIDNTNIKLWEMKKYVIEGQKYGYKIQIKQPETQWAWNYKQCAKKNNHSVPEQTTKRMMDNYQTFTSLEDIKAAKENFRRNNKH